VKYQPTLQRLRPFALRTQCVILAVSLTFGFRHLAAQPSDQASATELGTFSEEDLAGAISIQRSIVQAIAKSEQSVVAIARVPKDEEAGLLGPGGNPTPSDPSFVPSEYGSGLVLSPNGLILTNHHVVGNPEENDYYVWVGGKSYKATGVRAADPWMDLAVLEIKAEGLKPILFGNGENVKKGQFVVALGNPHAIARDGEPTASFGIISNTHRKAPILGNPRAGRDTMHNSGTLLQTDAALATGSSGGALVDVHGRLVGMTTMLVAGLGQTSPGGFAIPVDNAFRDVVSKLSQGKSPEYGFLGIVPAALSAANRRGGLDGVVVQSIIPNTPADTANLLLDDIIQTIDDKPILEPADLSRIVAAKPAGTVIEIKINRRGREVTKQVKLAKRYILSKRRPYSSIAPPRWRGMLVDQPTAIPSLIGRAHAIDSKGCVGVVDVTQDSPAWDAGIRSGDFISFVDDKRIESIDQFIQLTATYAGAVELVLANGDQQGEKRTISAAR
jgi:serine protease Do